MEVTDCTSSAVSALVRRRLSVSNFSQYHISDTLLHSSSSTHTIASSTILNLFDCDRQWPDIILDTVETNFLSSFLPSNQCQRETLGIMKWANFQCLERLTSSAIRLAKQILLNIKNRLVEVVYQKQHYGMPGRSPTSSTWDEIHIISNLTLFHKRN
jgi:hypothetical protein